MSRGQDVSNILEVLTQEYFDHICTQISTNSTIYPKDLQIIRATLGPITFHQFEHYVESMGVYTLLEE